MWFTSAMVFCFPGLFFQVSPRGRVHPPVLLAINSESFCVSCGGSCSRLLGSIHLVFHDAPLKERILIIQRASLRKRLKLYRLKYWKGQYLEVLLSKDFSRGRTQSGRHNPKPESSKLRVGLLAALELILVVVRMTMKPDSRRR